MTASVGLSCASVKSWNESREHKILGDDAGYLARSQPTAGFPLRTHEERSSYAALGSHSIFNSVGLTTACDAAQPVNTTSSGSLVVSTATYNANDPIEDRFLVQNVCLARKGPWWGTAPVNNNDWNFSAIFDGHGGWQVAEAASKQLVPEVIKELTVESKKGTRIEKDVVETSLLSGFRKVEQEYLDKVRDSFRLGFGEVAKVGACALMAVHHNNDLYLANCGDCRAVLGTSKLVGSSKGKGRGEGEDKKEKEGSNPPNLYAASRLTSDHNARMPLELLKLQQEHPGEDDVVVCKNPHACYVKGRLQLTRALGDAYLKYPEFNAPAGSHRSRGRHIPDPFTPPYVKSTPDIAHISLDEDDKFCVLATDGLWDFLSDQEAVDVVASSVKDGVPAAAAERLVQAALSKAAEEAGLTLPDLLALPAGRQRRSRHDDTTVVVLFF